MNSRTKEWKRARTRTIRCPYAWKRANKWTQKDYNSSEYEHIKWFFHLLLVRSRKRHTQIECSAAVSPWKHSWIVCVLLSFFGVQELCVFIWSSQLSVDNVFAYSALETHEIRLSLKKKIESTKELNKIPTASTNQRRIYWNLQIK